MDKDIKVMPSRYAINEVTSQQYMVEVKKNEYDSLKAWDTPPPPLFFPAMV